MNTMKGYCAQQSKFCDKLFSYMNLNYNWMKRMIARYGEKSAYWHQMDLILIQIEGIVATKNLSREIFKCYFLY